MQHFIEHSEHVIDIKEMWMALMDSGFVVPEISGRYATAIKK